MRTFQSATDWKTAAVTGTVRGRRKDAFEFLVIPPGSEHTEHGR
ncbi:MAG: hypothetical protein H6R27_1301 [Proteobacteria bacterium]|nr:hypothetical protein [Pseudomonadota bacterium]